MIILHEGDFDHDSQDEILTSIRLSCRNCVTFRALDKEDFTIPSHIDKTKMENCINLKPVPYWRNDTYRMMCRWWLIHFPKYTKGYDYVMRLDDDSIIEEPLKDDLFKIAEDKNLVYLSNFVHIDCGICNYGMKEFFENILPSHKDQINGGMFVQAALPQNNPYYERFKKVYALVNGSEYTGGDFITQMPLMYYNNFFVTSTAFWKQENVQDIIVIWMSFWN